LANRDDAKIRVQQATDIVRLIGEQIALRPKGREFAALCPFHDDSRPSMYVSPAKQIYKCFACGAGGDVFSFVMDYHKMTFPEALKYLADRAGIQVEPTSAGERGGAGGNRDQLREAGETAVRFFRSRLRDEQIGRVAREYLQSRGFSDETIDAFALGYAPDRWDGLAAALQQRRVDAAPFVEAGLLADRRDGSRYDRFRHRLMFPIFDAIGRPIAFGGRILAGSQLEDPTADAKYLNSPENPLFDKSRTLYGLNLAKKPIIDRRTAVIVEGYTDVIACHQAGFGNVVATLGTSLTRGHAQELRRYCDQVILVFDADEAGQKAADRALEVFFNEPIDVAVAILPEGLDPADLLAKDNGPAQWQEAMDRATDAMAFHFDRIRKAFASVRTLAGKQRIAEDYVRRLVELGLRQMEPTRRGMVLHQVAQLLRLDASTVDQMVRQIGRQARRSGNFDGEHGPAPDVSEPPPNARVQAEQLIVGCLLNEPELFHRETADGRPLDEAIVSGDLRHELTRRVFERLVDHLAERDELETADLRSMLEEETLIRFALDLKLRVERLTGGERTRVERELDAAVRALAGRVADEQYAASKMQDAGDESETVETDAEAARLMRAIEHTRAHPSAARTPRLAR